jgi:pantoate--beta-alanine ligase
VIHVSRSVALWETRRRSLNGRSIGFVPTMGALHEGHGSLVKRCRAENEVAVVSIFVNPMQFDDAGDLERYPRNIDQDISLLETVGADYVIMPVAHDLFPNGYRFRLEPDISDLVLEGSHRPGYLQGMMTVVLKLLNLVSATRAYFGEKDYQQLRIVSAMAREFFVPTKIIACPTVREKSGLAMSSRNALLPAEAREKAASLFHVLTNAATCAEAKALLEAQGFIVDYVEECWARRLAAVYIDGVRLIDNVPI